MPQITQIQIGSRVYDIKDAIARGEADLAYKWAQNWYFDGPSTFSISQGYVACSYLGQMNSSMAASGLNYFAMIQGWNWDTTTSTEPACGIMGFGASTSSTLADWKTVAEKTGDPDNLVKINWGLFRGYVTKTRGVCLTGWTGAWASSFIDAITSNSYFGFYTYANKSNLSGKNIRGNIYFFTNYKLSITDATSNANNGRVQWNNNTN